MVSLCWTKGNDSYSEEFIIAPSDYIAPSWSWASLTVKIGWLPLDKFQTQADVVKAHCEVSGLDPYGRVSRGYIILRGLVVSVPFYCKDAFDDWGYNIGTGDLIYSDDDSLLYVDYILTVRHSQPMRTCKGMDVVPYVDQVACLLLGEATTGRGAANGC